MSGAQTVANRVFSTKRETGASPMNTADGFVVDPDEQRSAPMGSTFRFRPQIIFSLALAGLLPACIFVEEGPEVYEAYPPSPVYTACFADPDCALPGFCEELAVPADAYSDFVNAICTVSCFDDLDCPVSDYNLFQGACVDEAWVGGPPGLRICIERCVVDADCDVYAGFGCELLNGERLCLPVR